MWIFSQQGAREHYAIPRALRQASRDFAMVTDLWWPFSWLRQPEALLGRMGAFYGRYHPELARETVYSFTHRELCQRLTSPSLRQDRLSDFYHHHLEYGQRYSRQVAQLLPNLHKRHQPRIFASYDNAFLEAAKVARDLGMKTVIWQTDADQIEYDIVNAESERYPEWVLDPTPIPAAVSQRRRQEWELADCVVVNSQWSFGALKALGVAPDKMQLIPLAYSPRHSVEEKALPPKKQPLTILWLGHVILRKGIHILVEAARQLQDQPVRFVVVGPVGINPDILKTFPPNIETIGRVGRFAVERYYREADLFVLPTLSDGFGLTQLEAMSHGLPVIATERCGQVVEHQENGQIIPAGEAAPLVEAIRFYLGNPESLSQHSQSARERATAFTIPTLGQHLITLEQRLLR